MKKTFIIAEAGVNHNGNYELAIELIDVAKNAGVDAVKFQTWKTELLLTKDAKLAEYQTKNVKEAKNQFQMIKRLELSYEDFQNLHKYCAKNNIIFLSTADELESARFLKDLQDIFKIGSGEITNLPYLEEIGSYQKKIIISTGMATLDEIGNALEILERAGTKKSDITVLHCNTEYPTPFEDVNLLAMLAIRDKYNVDVGYSDHTLGIEVPIAAVALGAKVIEKHFTLNRNMAGPDHSASLEPDELAEMVKAIRHIESAKGTGEKKPSPSERKNVLIVRKSIVAATQIRKGDIIGKNNITAKRPGGGISPMKWHEVVGTRARRNYNKDDMIEL